MTRNTKAYFAAAFIFLGVTGPLVVYSLRERLTPERPDVHTHGWSQWKEPVKETDGWIQFRSCTNCGLSEWRKAREVK